MCRSDDALFVFGGGDKCRLNIIGPVSVRISHRVGLSRASDTVLSLHAISIRIYVLKAFSCACILRPLFALGTFLAYQIEADASWCARRNSWFHACTDRVSVCFWKLASGDFARDEGMVFPGVRPDANYITYECNSVVLLEIVLGGCLWFGFEMRSSRTVRTKGGWLYGGWFVVPIFLYISLCVSSHRFLLFAWFESPVYVHLRDIVLSCFVNISICTPANSSVATRIVSKGVVVCVGGLFFS